MSEPTLPDNHASPGSPSLVYGRDNLFPTLTTMLQAGQSICLIGEPQMGKTAVLHALSHEFATADSLPLMLDLADLAGNSLALFWWDLSEAIAALATAAGVELPARARSTFAAEPFAAFQAHLLNPLQDAANGRALLLLLDNADTLLTRLADDAALTTELGQLLTVPDVRTVLASNIAVPNLPTAVQPILHPLAQHTLGPLSQAESLAIVRSSAAFTAAPDVADYLFDLTDGAPAALDTLMQRLAAYATERGIRHIQIADVTAVRQALARDVALQPANYRIGPTAEQNDRIRQARRARWWQQIRGPLAVAALLVALLLLGLGSTVWQRNNVTAVAALSGDKPVPSATPAATPTPFPTATATTAPTRATGSQPSAATPILPSPTPTATPDNDVDVDTAQGAADPTAVVTREIDGMPMRYVPGGTFTMGAADDDFLAGVDEKPQHQVTLSGFYMDQFEVSVAQYAAFLNEIGDYERACGNVDCTLPRSRVGFTSRLLDEDLGDGTIQYVPETGYSNHPANHISWYGAQSYCEFVGGRLPTEAEWEYAARGKDGRVYPWGNSPPDNTRAVFNSESYNDLLPVDAQPDGASPFGIYAMAGSMWEWTADWYDEDSYERGNTRNPTGPEAGLTRVIRGGSWPFNNGADRLRASNRHSLDPEFISATMGFRCVVDLAE